MDSNARAMFLMAHPDDAEFHCGGTLLKLAAAGWSIDIVSMTAGECGSHTLDPVATATLRCKEGTQAAASLGGAFHCLDEPDGMLMYDRPTLCKCVDLFRQLCPTLVITHHPHDYHMDHVATSQLARAASFIYPAPNSSTVPAAHEAEVPHLYYADPNEGVDEFGRNVPPSTYIDITSQLQGKVELMHYHESQIQWLLEHHGVETLGESIREHAIRRGAEVGVAAAEAFVQHRGHGYPRTDLLAEHLGNAKSSLNASFSQ